MNKKIGYGIVAVMALLVTAALGVAQIYSVYNPIQKQNVPIDRVSIDQIKAWASAPAFSKWTNMEGLEEYLAEKGVSLDELLTESKGLSSKENLGLRNTNRVTKNIQRISLYNDGEAITDIDCDVNDGEMEFELTNIGNDNWFLVYQELTTGVNTDEGRKQLAGIQVQAKQIELYINGYPVNSKTSKYKNGQKLFYPEGESFATACGADFLRSGRSVECNIEPIPVRTGMIKNSYTFFAPGVTETGQFECS